MEKILNILNLALFFVSYAVLIIPAFIILFIADLIKKRASVKIFDPDMMHKFEG
jgi:hypothetical protein